MILKSQRGIALLIAALISAVVISIGAAIFSIVQKQLTLSSVARESQFAFYTADTGAECALYWDTRFSYFSSTSTPPTGAVCDTQPITPSWSGASVYPYISTFQFAPNNRCVFVTVTKCDGPFVDGVCTHDVLHIPAPIHTSIRSDGYNVACNATSTSKIGLQRSVQLNY
ncbi:MAG: seg [Candidatus Kaiserbacteria bacterium]|nr:seg [Candidatus Kaiserbacteria bacterium]